MIGTSVTKELTSIITLNYSFSSLVAGKDDFGIIKNINKSSSYRRCSIKNVFLTISKKLREDICARVSFLILRPATLLKKRFCNRCFPVNFAKFLTTVFFTEQLLETASETNKNPS